LEDRKNYAEFILQEDEQAEDILRKATRAGRPYGSEAFLEKMELQLNRALKPRKPGRPRK
jgi:putative transposase